MSIAVVVFRNTGSSSVAISAGLVRNLKLDSNQKNQTCLELQGRSIYCVWNGKTIISKSKDEVIEFDYHCAKALGLKQLELVSLNALTEPPVLVERVWLEPLTQDDWEIVELNSDYVQSNLLEQTRIVWPSQSLSVWVQKTVINFFVVKLEPHCRVGRLEPLTEVIISPKSDCRTLPSRDNDVTDNVIGRVYRVHPLPPIAKSKTELSTEEGKLEIDKYIRSPNTVFVLSSKIKKPFSDVIVRVNRVMKPGEGSNSVSRYGRCVVVNGQSECRKLKLIAQLLNVNRGGVCLMSDTLRRELRAEIGSRVSLFPVVEPKFVYINALKLFYRNLSDAGSAEVDFRNWLKSVSSVARPLLLNREMVMVWQCGGGTSVEVYLDYDEPSDGSESVAVVIENSAQISTHQLTDEHRTYLDVADLVLPPVKKNFNNPALGGMQEVITAVKNYVFSVVGSGIDNPPISFSANKALMLTGPSGSGKTAIVSHIANQCSQPHRYVYSSVLDCKSMKGKQVESVRKIWRKTIDDVIYRAPAILVFEDLDHLCCTTKSADQETGGETAYYTRMTNAFIDTLLEDIPLNRGIAVLVTAASVGSLHPALVSFKGRHYFGKIISVQQPSDSERVDMVKTMLENEQITVDSSALTAEDWRAIGSKTDGCLAGDLQHLVERVVHHGCASRAGLGSFDWLKLHSGDFDVIFADFKPFALRDLSLHKPEPKTWTELGGLPEVRKALTETLLWPSKYPTLFKNCPLRLPAGVLLYGPPGTGKTLVAGIVAHECRMNFISVKGPELLSKFIGASEEAVRDVFRRAQTSKPCLIFFDEFESLAPRRGHDSTGVTDRVVNQLLTQLDGVEELTGVYVLAATSRPDLIDPALLRPGRLDKCLYCPLPNQGERLEILCVLSRELPLVEEEGLLEEVAAMTESYSGADLKAVLSAAHLMAVHRAIDLTAKTSASDVVEHLAVTRRDLIQAVQSTTCSVSPLDRQLYEKRFSMLRSNKGPASDPQPIAQRATLA